MPNQPETEIDRYSAPSGLASAIGESAARYGIDILPICKALDLDPSTFSDLTGRISLDRLCRLLETCALIANDDTFGLKTIEFYKPGSSGPYGYGLMTAPTALDFFRFVGDHQHYASDKSYAKFSVDRQGAEVSFSYSPLIVKRDQYVDMVVGLIMQRLRAILGADIDAIEVGLERPKPRNIALYREKISRKVSFGRRVNSLRLPPELYFVNNPQGDDRLFRLMDLQCRSLRSERTDGKNFSEELKEFILTRVSESAISLNEAADYFHVSERTLQRRLAETGTSLNDLRDAVRRSLAEKLLSETELSAAEIALRLGYSAPSAFTRSTIRWFGKTPRDYRKSAI
ncbi:MAG: helix-turn-helix domain protein [Rhizobium sp.]|nr:helix-turn-helix domain protein [Rhizobium sp.]